MIVVQRRAGVEDWPFFQEILDRWKKRESLDPDTFRALGDEMKGQAFTSVRLAWGRAIEAAHGSILDALEGGKTVRDWKADSWDEIAARFGKPGATDPAYMDMLFRTTTQNAYAGGRYAEMFRPDWNETEPYWQYSSINDARTRPQHRALDGRVFRKDDPYSRRYLPPLGFNCRCQAIPLMEEDVKAGGWKISNGADLYGEIGPPPIGWDSDRVASLVNPSLRARFLGPPDPAVTERIIRSYEKDLRAIKTHEEGILFDQYGLVEWRGRAAQSDPYRLPMPNGLDAVGGIFTHNHPSGYPLTVLKRGARGEWGGDLRRAVIERLSQVRATRISQGIAITDCVTLAHERTEDEFDRVAAYQNFLLSPKFEGMRGALPGLRRAIAESILEEYIVTVCKELGWLYTTIR